MKKFILLAFAALSMSAQAQVFHAPKSQRAVFTDTTTTFKYVMSDNKEYKVFRSNRGAFYLWKISKKTGKLYKMYLPKEVQIKMGRKY